MCEQADLTSGNIEKCTAINVEWAKLSAGQVENLIRALAVPTMTFLRLRGVGLSAEQSEAIMKAVSLSTNLQNLIFREHAFSTSAAKNLAKALAAGTLRILDLRDTVLHDEGAMALAEGLMENKSLEFVDVNGCDVGADGMVSLAKAVVSHPTLESLHATNNPIGDAGAVALGAAIQAQGAAGGPLQEVLVFHSDIGGEGRTALRSAALANNEAVKMWDLKREQIRKSWAHELGLKKSKDEL